MSLESPRPIWSLTKLQFTPQFTPWLTNQLAPIVAEPAIQSYRLALLLLDGPLPSREVNVAGCYIADPFLAAPIIEILDQLCYGCTQNFQAGEYQQIKPGLDTSSTGSKKRRYYRLLRAPLGCQNSLCTSTLALARVGDAERRESAGTGKQGQSTPRWRPGLPYRV